MVASVDGERPGPRFDDPCRGRRRAPPKAVPVGRGASTQVMGDDGRVTAAEEALVRLGLGEPGSAPTPYVELDRTAWSRLRENHPMSLTQDDLARLRGLGDLLDLQ